MTEGTPEKSRQRSPYTRSVNTVLVRFTVRALPPDAESLSRERKGRPERSPSLPPEESKAEEKPPTA